MAPYSYTALDESINEIRLLKLLPGPLSADLKARLHKVVTYAEAGTSFEALSYTWGSTDDPGVLTIESDSEEVEGSLSITHNLEAALRHLRDPANPRIFWIDAVCVNQQDLKERGSQVERMCDIYRTATRVVVWLGPEEDDSNYAMDLLESVGSKIEVDWGAVVMRPALSSEAADDLVDRKKPLPFEKRGLDALDSLFHRSWFERLWIRQEIRLANAGAIVACGSSVIRWTDFRKAIFCIPHKAIRPELLGQRAVPFHERIELIFSLGYDETSIPFGRLIRTNKNCKCTDPRDRVFAVLNTLSKTDQEIGIKPDYTKSTTQVYEDVAIRFINHFNRLNILTSCEMQDTLTEGPTWVPDWQVDILTNPLWGVAASGEFPAEVQYDNDGVLKVTGVHTATIKHAKKINFATSSGQGIVDALRAVALPNIADKSQLYIDGGSMLDAYCRTMCCDQFADWYIPHLPNFPDFQKSRAALLAILEPEEDGVLDTKPGTPAGVYCDYVWSLCRGRSFFTTEEGFIGLGPASTRSGDRICVLLGCPSPLILRPCGAMQYQVVGESYVHKLTDSEALLGQIPSEFEAIYKLDHTSAQWNSAYLHVASKEIRNLDPRLESPASQGGDGSAQQQPSSTSKLSVADLRARSVILRTFHLV